MAGQGLKFGVGHGGIVFRVIESLEGARWAPCV
jgi:hypothetical protein